MSACGRLATVGKRPIPVTRKYAENPSFLDYAMGVAFLGIRFLTFVNRQLEAV